MRVAIGRIGKPLGLAGWVTVRLSTDSPAERFVPGTSVYPDEASQQGRVLAEARAVSGRWQIRLEGVDDRPAAEGLRGQWMWVDIDPRARPQDPDEVYDHHLVGLRVDVAGDCVGVVTDVLHLPGQDILVVEYGGAQVLVPFVRQIVPEVDLAGGRVVVDPPPGLFGEDVDEA